MNLPKARCCQLRIDSLLFQPSIIASPSPLQLAAVESQAVPHISPASGRSPGKYSYLTAKALIAEVSSDTSEITAFWRDFAISFCPTVMRILDA